MSTTGETNDDATRFVTATSTPIDPQIAPPAPRRPKPWLAVLLSLLQPGLGHLYVWRPRRAAAFWASSVAASALVIWGMVGLPWLLALTILLLAAVVVYVATARDAWRAARSTRNTERSSRGRLALALVGFVALTATIKRNVVEAFHIPSGAMEPTILQGDYLFVRPRRGASIVRDQLYSFRGAGVLLLKRVVALGGDTLEMRHGLLYRNASLVSEPYAHTSGSMNLEDADFGWQRTHLVNAVSRSAYRPTADNWGPLVVPEGDVFVLGDNRHASRDSRYLGFVASDSVLGWPQRVYFSRDPDDGIRWDRIGLEVERFRR
jgi:signal peptidase I